MQTDIVLPFSAIDHTSLSLVGGKAANLGDMARAGLPVPPGFCVTTAAYALVAGGADLEPTLAALATTRADDTARLAELATAARDRLLSVPVPAVVAEAITAAYRALGNDESVPVAVRSSATAEDLPYASFAGQQDTYLNIVGVEAVLDAVRRCWASLWTDRAVSYRVRNGIDPRTVRLAVVVQRMVDATVAGVLFTANPLTGKRRQAVIDASPGLGEAVVSGAVNPDHFVVNTTTGEIVERRLGDKRVMIQATSGGGTQRLEQAEPGNEACLSDDQVRALAHLGAKVEAHFGAPQDTEWAIDSSGHLWLTQARPITTLFPLPANAPTIDDELRVYLSLSVVQGVYRPLTPMGLQTFRLISSAAATFVLGRPPQNPLAGLPFLADMGQRLFIDATPILRNALGREIVIRILQNMEARSAVIFKHLVTDPRLASSTSSKWSAIRKLLPIVIRTKIPLLMLRALLRPEAARKRIANLEAQLRQQSTVSPEVSSNDHLAAFERRISLDVVRVVRTVFPAAFAGIGSQTLATVLLKGIATPDEVQTVLRSLPHNPTTEMDLSLWALAQQIRVDPAVAGKVSKTPPEKLAQEYRERRLPPLLQQGLAEFLRTYGHRGVAEIDLGLARWSEDPTHILGVLANYLQLKNPDLAPDVQFDRGAQEAKAMVMELTQRARHKGWLYGTLVRFYLKRIRELAGIREVPKYVLILLLARGRALLWPVGEELARARRLEKAEDIFFVSIPEARAALAGEDLRALVRARRASYDHELSRRHVPRVLLSDGTEPTADMQTTEMGDGTLRGTPASAGMVTAKARVVLDPAGARLEPGEILVAPSTDPGWTPLFLTAGGLVMEMGGAMSHGAVVAREYGIPAVVGVPGATEHISTGQRITVNGSAGIVRIEGDTDE
jgi:pyruvate,water dikinase